tara:strand:+ start:357 stop:1127 length:771 start_codon:yes stop_codon:yes gene_type:complete
MEYIVIKIFIFGMQRSGTSILSSVLGELPDSYHYPEVGADINSEQFKEGGQTIRLKSLEEVERIFSEIPKDKKFIVSKPIVESQNAFKILKHFPESFGLWCFRHYKDVIASHTKKWDLPISKEFFKPVLNRSNENWRSEALSEKSIKIFEDHYRPDMSIENALALFWVIRNQLYFSQDLPSLSCIRLVSYERMVSESDYLQNLLNDVGVPIRIEQREHKFNSGSLQKGDNVVLDERIDEVCRDMFFRLQDLERKSL